MRRIGVAFHLLDQAWGDWLVYVLEAAGVSVLPLELAPSEEIPALASFRKATGADAPEDVEDWLLILSPDSISALVGQASNLGSLLSEKQGNRGRLLALEVRDCDVPEELQASPLLVPLLGLDESAAHDAVLQKTTQSGHVAATQPGGRPSVSRPPFPGDSPAVQNVPYTRNREFVGRSAALKELRSLLFQPAREKRLAPQSVAIVGQHGIGKTELAAEYAARYAPLYSVIWWVRANDPVTLALDLADLAAQLSLHVEGRSEEALEKQAVDWLSRNSGWLLIFDGVSQRADIESYIPDTHNPTKDQGGSLGERRERGHILFTAEQKDWQGWAYVLPVLPWARSESVGFLQRSDPAAPREAVAVMAALMQDWPLALKIVRGCNGQQAIEPLLQNLAAQRRVLPEETATGLALALAFPLIIPGTATHDLLCLCAFLGDDIPLTKTTLMDLARHVVSLQSENSLRAACSELVSLGLAAPSALCLAIHPMVLSAWRSALSLSSATEWANTALVAAQAAVHGNWPLASERRLLPHVLATARWSLEQSFQPDAAARLLSDAASYLAANKQGPVAWRLLWLVANHSSSIHPDTLASALSRWGALATRYGNLDDAERWLKQALGLWRRETRAETRRAECLLNLGRLSIRKHEHEAAREQFEAAQAQITRVQDVSPQLRADLATELAELALQRGDFLNADALLATAVEHESSLAPTRTEQTCALLMRRAAVQRARGLWADALGSLRTGLSLAETHLPAGHLSVGVLACELGLTESALGQYDHASEHLKNALKLLQDSGLTRFRYWRNESPYTIDAQIEGCIALSRLLRHAGDPTAAAEVVDRATIFFNKRYPPVASAMLENVKVLWAAKAPARAQTLLAEVLTILKEVSPPAGSKLVEALLLDAKLRQGLGDFDGAAASLTDAEERLAKAYGVRHPRLVSVWLARAEVAGERADYQSLLADSLSAFSLATAVLGPKHPASAEAAVSLATAYIRLRDPAKAETLCREALVIDRGLYLEPHPRLVRDLEVLGDALVASGNLTEARAHFAEAARIQETLRERDRTRPRLEWNEAQASQKEPFRLARIRVEGFRALHSVTAKLEGLNVLLGPNGSGKTALLDLFALLSNAMQGELQQGVVARGGFQRLLTLDRARRLRLSLESAEMRSRYQPPQRIEYTLELSAAGTSYVVPREEMLLRTEGAPVATYILRRQRDRVLASVSDWAPQLEVIERWGRDVPPLPAQESAAAWLSHQEERSVHHGAWQGQPLYRHLLNATFVPPVPIDAAAPLRHPQALRPSTGAPRGDGSDLLSVLHNLRIEQPEWFEQVEDALRAGFPSLSRLDFPIVGAGQVSLAWYERGRVTPVFANELSAGTLRFLLLCTVLLSPNPPRIILLDEPEVSLHPHLLRLLAELLIQCADRSQIFVATHAAALLRWLQPQHVMVIDRDDDGVSLRRGSDLNLKDWLDRYTLDQLWDLGELGGRP